MINKKFLRPPTLMCVLSAALMMMGCQGPYDRPSPPSEASESVTENPEEPVSETETGQLSLYEIQTEPQAAEETSQTEGIDLTDPEHAGRIDRFLNQSKAVLGDDFRFPKTTGRLHEDSRTEDLTEAMPGETAEEPKEDLAQASTEEAFETVLEDPENINAEKTSEPAAGRTDMSLMQEQTEMVSEGLTEPVPEGLTQEETEAAPESLTEEETETVPESLTEEETGAAPEGLTEEETGAAPEGLTEEETETEAPPALHQLLHEVAPADHFKTLDERFTITGWSIPAAQRTAYMLQVVLERQIAAYDGTWSVYMRDLTKEGPGSVVSVNVQPMKSASIMKLFIMGAAYDAMSSGRLPRTDEVISRITGMIRSSSNTDANRLLEILGGGSMKEGIREVNSYIERSGYSSLTRQYNGFDNSDYVFDQDHNNTVYPPDCARFLEKIYHREFGSRKICNEIENMMIEQQTRYKIPKGIARISDGVVIGNKTGEMDAVENDVAIVYSPSCDYILCVFSSGWSDKETALTQIQSISEQVYRFFNDSSWLSGTVHLPYVVLKGKVR